MRIIVTYADRYRPRFGFTLKTWPCIVDLAIAYAAADGGYDWPDGVMPVQVSPRLLFARHLVETGRLSG